MFSGVRMADDLSDIRTLIAGGIRDVLMDDALFRPKAGGPDVPVRIKKSEPSEATVLQGASIVQAKPIIETFLSDVPVLVAGDMFVYHGTIWRVASAPKRPGSGIKWHAEVEPIGAA